MRLDTSLGRSKSRVWCRLLVILLISLVQLAWAGDRITSRAYLEDFGGNLKLEQVQTSSSIWTPFEGILTKGYTDSAIWLKIHINPLVDTRTEKEQHSKALSTSDDKLILRIRPAVLDEIALFDPLEPSAIPRLSGDLYPFSADEYQSLNFNFVIPKGTGSRTIWMRLKTTSTNLILVEALSPNELHASDRRIELAFNVLLAFLMLFLAWGMMHWAISKDKVVGAFVVKQAIGLALVLSTTGYLRVLAPDWVPAGWIDQITGFIVLSYSASLVWFDYQLLSDYRPPRWGMQLLKLFLFMYPCVLMLFWLNNSMVALRMNSAIYFVVPLLSLLLTLLSKPFSSEMGELPPVVSRKVLIVMFSAFAVTFSVPVLVFAGMLQAKYMSMYVIYTHGLITGFVMLVVLHVRSGRIEARRLQTQIDLSLAQQHAVEEHQQRLEQSQFMSMLTHELKTALSVMRLVLGSKVPAPSLVQHAEKAVLDMTNVIERCQQAELLADGQLVVLSAAVSLRSEFFQLMCNSPSHERLNLTMTTEVVLQTDAKLMRIVLANLLDNANKYSSPDSAIDFLIELEAHQTVSGVSIVVQNIPGIAGWPDAAKVFQKYYRSSSAHHQTGTGLGLYLVHSIVHKLGGEFTYVPDEIFVRFKLWLPL